MLTYRATLEVPLSTVARVSGWIQAHRKRVDARPWQRAATSWAQAVLVLAGSSTARGVAALARDTGIGQATAYRYPREGIDVIPAQAQDLSQVVTDPTGFPV